MLNQSSSQGSTSVAQGVTTVIFCDPNATRHQIKLNKNTATAGTLTLTGTILGADTAETIYDQFGVAIVFNHASSTAQTYVIDGVFTSFTVTPAGDNGTYKYHYSGW